MNLDDIAKKTNEGFQNHIIRRLNSATKRGDNDNLMSDGERFKNTTFVYNNDISRIISNALAATKEVKGYMVYFQPNSFDFEITDFFPYEHQKQKFTDFCNYADKYKAISISDFKKTLFNYSKNSQKEVYTEYPSDLKMILIFGNFNFWDLKSQYILSNLSQNPNIMVIGQIRTDFDFAANHLDEDVGTYASHIQFEEG
jgi:hypothetical protein